MLDMFVILVVAEFVTDDSVDPADWVVVAYATEDGVVSWW